MIFFFYLSDGRKERERGNVHGVSLPELDHLFNNSKTICTSLQCTAYTFDRDYCGGLLLYFNSNHVFNTKKKYERDETPEEKMRDRREKRRRLDDFNGKSRRKWGNSSADEDERKRRHVLDSLLDSLVRIARGFLFTLGFSFSFCLPIVPPSRFSLEKEINREKLTTKI